MSHEPKKVAVIGGGISGLSAAYFLSKINSFQITVFEASPRLGGVIETEPRDGFLLEGGPDAFLSEKTAAAELCKELGLSDQIIGTQKENRRSLIYKNGRLDPVPAGFYLFSPTSFQALVKTPALSFAGKLRMAGEFFLPAAKSGEDESVSDFISRRFGQEALVRIGQPMVGGIYMADPSRLSLQATFPKFKEMEAQHGSVIRGLAFKKKSEMAEASGPRYGLFLTLKNGLETLIKALIEKMPRVDFRTSSAVEKVERSNGRWKIGALEFDAICLAIPSYQAARLVGSFADRELIENLQAIAYESAATINLAYRKEDIPAPLNAFGFVIPAEEKRKIAACSFSSLKYENRAPEESVLLRAFVGGALGKEALELSDPELGKVVREELRSILKIEKPPLFVSIRRYPKSMPQYHVGHLARVQKIEEQIQNYAGLYLAGNAYRGVGIGDCIASGRRAAEAIRGLSPEGTVPTGDRSA